MQRWKRSILQVSAQKQMKTSHHIYFSLHKVRSCKRCVNCLPSNPGWLFQPCVFYKAGVIQAHNSHMAHIWKFKCHCLLPGFVWGLSEVSALNCTSLSACLLPMMHFPISSLAKALKETIVPVTLRHVACTYDTKWEKLFPLYPWNVFESINSLWRNAAL